jgi:GxxExxY protein
VEDRFNYEKINLKNKERIKDLLFIANRIFITLGAGYFHQIYRRAFHYELNMAGISFAIIKQLSASYRNTSLGSKEVNFFRLGDMLLSILAVNEFNRLILLKFRNYIKRLKCKRGLIFNFKSTILDFRYIEL